MAKPPATWKRVELDVAKALGGIRMGILGNQDVQTDRFSIEVKHRDANLKTLQKWMQQAEDNCKEGCIPLVVEHTKGSRLDESLVVIRLKHFRELVNERNGG